MPYNHLEDLDVAGVALRAWGHTLEDMFLAASDAMLQAMVADPDALTFQENYMFEGCETSLELSLHTFLHTFIHSKNHDRTLLRVAQVSITRDRGNFRVRTRAEGVPWHPDMHRLTTDVQRVDLSRIQIVEMPDAWTTTFVLEV